MATIGRALASALLAGLAGAAALAGVYALRPGLTFDMSRDAPSLMEGFYRSEAHDRETYAWTGATARISLPGLDRRSPWTFRVRVRGGRSDPSTLPDVTVGVDGITALTRRVSNAFEELSVPLPASETQRGATVTLAVSNTFEPGPQDRRQLGVVVDQLVVTPATGIVLPPRGALLGASLAAATMGAGFAAIGLTAGSAIGVAILVALLQALPIAYGFGPHSPLAGRAAWLAVWVTLGMGSIVWSLDRLRSERLRQTARFAVAFPGAIVYLKLLVLLHPDMFVGDAMFHAHRFNDVLQGRYFFTSVAPGLYRFPYAIGLYVAAAPWQGLIRNVGDSMAALRVLTVAVDAVAGGLLYLMIVRAWGDRLAGALAVAIYFLIPLSFGVQTVGNLTNVFAQTWFVIALVLIASPRAHPGRPVFVAATALAIAVAFLSHTSTFAILSVVVFGVALLYRFAGGAVLRPASTAVLLALGAALVLSVGVYYAHFGDVYRSEYLRITNELARPAAASDPAQRSVFDRGAAVPLYAASYFGGAAMVLATAGIWRLWQTGARDRLGLILVSWCLGSMLFLVIGVLTPVDMRHYLAAFPALAILAGVGASWGWRASAAGRAAVAALLAWAVITSGSRWIGTLG